MNDGGDVDGVGVGVLLCVVQQPLSQSQHLGLVQPALSQCLELEATTRLTFSL